MHLKDAVPLTDPLESRVYIDTDAALNAACKNWATAAFLAIDTEFTAADGFTESYSFLQ